MRPILALALAASVLIPTVRAVAAPTSAGLSVGLNESRRIPLRGQAATIVVGDPSVADVTVTDAHSLVLIGKGYGETELLVTDAHGRPLLEGEVSVVDADDGRVTVFRGDKLITSYACVGGRCYPTGVAAQASGGAPDASQGATADASSPVSDSGAMGPVNGQAIQPSPGIP